MSQTPDIKTVKSVLRGLLVSYPSQQRTVAELNNDYKREEGTSIPFGAFGFSSNLEFFRSISDTVHVVDNYGQIVIKPVVNRSTAHVSSLVKRQSNPKKRAAPRTFHPQGATSPYPPSYGNQGNWSTGRLRQNPGGGVPSYYSPPPRLQPLLQIRDFSRGRYGPSHGSDDFVDHSYNRNAASSVDPGYRSQAANPVDRADKPQVANPVDRADKPHGANSADNAYRPRVASPVDKTNAMQTPTKPNIFFPPNLQQKIIQFVSEQPGISVGELGAKANEDYQFTNLNKMYKMEELVSIMSHSLRISGNKVFVLDNKLKDLPSVSKSRVTTNNSPKPIIMPAGYEDYDDIMQDLHYDEDGFSLEPMPPSALVARGRAKKSPSASSGHQSIVNGNSCSPKRYSNAQAYPDEESRPAYQEDKQVSPCRNENQDTAYKEEQYSGGGDFQASAISEHIKRRITKLLESDPSGIWCSQLPKKYLEAFNSKLSFYDLGYVSIVQMLSSVPELFTLVHVDNADWKVLDARTHPAGSTIPDSVRANINKLLSPMRNGIRIDDVQSSYELKFGSELNLEEMGFRRLEDLFASLEGMTVCIATDADSRPRIYKMGKQPDSPVVPYTKDDPSIREYFGPDVVAPDFVTPRLVLPPTVVKLANLEVLVAAIFRPDHFYIQLRRPGYSKSIDTTMDDMFRLYTKEADTYRMPRAAMVPGIYVCCFTENEYHRGLVMCVNHDDTCVMKLVDYGNCRRVHQNDIYFLHKDYASLPPQAIACRCANLWPLPGRTTFTRAAGFRLLELVMDKAMVATVAQVDHERLCLSVCLVDTTGDDDVHINDLLEKEGHAIYRHDLVGMVNDVSVAAADATPAKSRALSLVDRLRLRKESTCGNQNLPLLDRLRLQKESTCGNESLTLLDRLRLQKESTCVNENLPLLDRLRLQKESTCVNENLPLLDRLRLQKESTCVNENLTLLDRLRLQKESTCVNENLPLLDRLRLQKESTCVNENLTLLDRLRLQKESTCGYENLTLLDRLRLQKESTCGNESLTLLDRLRLQKESASAKPNCSLMEGLKMQKDSPIGKPGLAPVEKLKSPTQSPVIESRNIALAEKLELQEECGVVATPNSDRSVAPDCYGNVSVSDARGVAETSSLALSSDTAGSSGAQPSEPERAMYNESREVLPSQSLSAYEKLSVLRERLAI